MAQPALDLLNRWTAENAEPVLPDQRQAEAARLAAEFSAYAEDAGLSAEQMAELRAEMGGDLAAHMEGVLEALGSPKEEPPGGEAA